MNVLSLFDGISCGQIAFQRAGIDYDNYFASEIEQSAIQVTQSNYPSTIQLGDVTKIVSDNLPNIDLLIGGSPCQGFSLAGKKLNLEDPRSKLFFEYVRLKNELNPTYFLLENVKMNQQSMDIISEHLGVEPVLINSSLVSAQDRKRLYWTNIPFEMPEDRCIYLRDILENDPHDDLFLKPEYSSRYKPNLKHKKIRNKSCVMGRLSKYQGDRVFDVDCKASSLSAAGGNNGGGGCNLIFDPKYCVLRKLSVTECERLQTVPEDYTKSIRNTKAYKALGNGWTVDVIAHIFRGMKQ